MKSSQEERGKALCTSVLLHLGQMRGMTQHKPKVDTDWNTDNTRTKPYPQWAKRATVDNWTEGKNKLSHNSSTHIMHIGDIPEVLNSSEWGYCTIEYYSTSSYSHYLQEQEI